MESAITIITLGLIGLTALEGVKLVRRDLKPRSEQQSMGGSFEYWRPTKNAEVYYQSSRIPIRQIKHLGGNTYKVWKWPKGVFKIHTSDIESYTQSRFYFKNWKYPSHKEEVEVRNLHF